MKRATTLNSLLSGPFMGVVVILVFWCARGAQSQDQQRTKNNCKASASVTERQLGISGLLANPPYTFRRVILGRIDKRRDLVSFKFLRQDWLGYKREYQVVPNRFFKPLPTHISAIHDRHPVVDSTHQRICPRRDDREAI